MTTATVDPKLATAEPIACWGRRDSQSDVLNKQSANAKLNFIVTHFELKLVSISMLRTHPTSTIAERQITKILANVATLDTVVSVGGIRDGFEDLPSFLDFCWLSEKKTNGEIERLSASIGIVIETFHTNSYSLIRFENSRPRGGIARPTNPIANMGRCRNLKGFANNSKLNAEGRQFEFSKKEQMSKAAL